LFALFFQGGEQDISAREISDIDLNDKKQQLLHCLAEKTPQQFIYHAGENNNLLFEHICQILNSDNIDIISFPLLNRKQEIIGLLFMANRPNKQKLHSDNWLAFTTMLSHFSAVSLESRQLIHQQKALMQSFIELIASAIDSKSPYTGGHCQRVPELTKLLAQATCDSKDSNFNEYNLNADEWEELHFAAWLHDCGKVTTPEYVVDKATKLVCSCWYRAGFAACEVSMFALFAIVFQYSISASRFNTSKRVRTS